MKLNVFLENVCIASHIKLLMTRCYFIRLGRKVVAKLVAVVLETTSLKQHFNVGRRSKTKIKSKTVLAFKNTVATFKEDIKTLKKHIYKRRFVVVY